MMQDKGSTTLFGLTLGSIVVLVVTFLLIGGFVPATLQMSCANDEANIWCTATPTNTPTMTPTSTNTPTHTSTPTNTGTPTNTSTPTNTGTPTNTSTPTPTDTSTPTETLTPTPTPYRTTARVTISGNSNLLLRRRPIADEGIIERLANGTVITITGKTSDDEWYFAEAPSGKQGWVNANFAILLKPDELKNIPISATPLPPITSTPRTITPGKPFPLNAGASTQYNFTAEEEESIILIAIDPNVNKQGLQVMFKVRRLDSTGQEEAGAGGRYSEFPVRFSGLSWRGGQQGQRYSVDITNNSDRGVVLCLSRQEVFDWICQ